MSEPSSAASLPPKLTPDQIAAHEFLSELRTRITTQPLPYQHGVEARALESLWEMFKQAREAMKRNPGCEAFAALVTEALNIEVRPLTAKWDKAHEEGRLRSQDGADAFRGELLGVQEGLRVLAQKLHTMAYGTSCPDRLTGLPISPDEIGACFQELEYGLPRGGRIDDELIAAINESEKSDVQTRRWNHKVQPKAGHDAVGLALSGGGIRSATFCLGVVQVLAERQLLKEVDFLSTVSGGGYTGSFLTRTLGREGAKPSDVGAPHGPDTEPVRYVRHHAKFLDAGGLKKAWRMVAETLAGMLLNWSVPLFMLVLAAGAWVLLERWLGVPATWLPRVAGALGALTVAALVGFAFCLTRGPGAANGSSIALATVSGLLAAVCALWAIEALAGKVPQWIKSSSRVAGALGTVLLAAPALLRFLPVLRKPGVRDVLLKGILYVAGLLVPILAIWAFYVLVYVGNLDVRETESLWNPLRYTNGRYILVAIAAFLGVLWTSLNINLTGPHRLYRDGLGRTFVQWPDSKLSAAPLAAVNPGQTAPYHLINAALNVPSSHKPELRGRRSDFFFFSRHWTGSAVAKIKKTTEWSANGKPVDLATAMAISGAAVSSHMGLGSMPALSALLTFLNVRLGFWIKNPEAIGKRRSKHPGFVCLVREMLGVGMREDKKWLNLSDGGHIENLGVYELLHRRCKFILCVDGEADPAFQFHGLMTLVRHAQIDFGVRIDPKLDSLRPDPATGYSQRHAHLCRIHYPAAGDQEGGIGLLLYLKLSVTGNESELIRRYRACHPDFPHQSTLDQFFDQEQFEAYRQLGVHIAEGLFSTALMDGGTPQTTRDWFRRLATNLLEPELPAQPSGSPPPTP